MKKLCTIILSFILIFMLNACSSQKVNTTNDSPEITVKAGDTEITSVVKSKSLEEVTLKKEADRMTMTGVNLEDVELFQSIMNDPSITIPYVSLGETIQIEFNETTPTTYELVETLLSDDGTLKYKAETIENIQLTLTNRKGSFVLDENVWAHLSSNSDDYEPEATIRGFRLICQFTDKVQEFSFIIKTDATK
ncbi:hypothetical protein [Caldalkalibacillus mannanilyticus]|uniref:hypothetical protein n=1 Tax=Caldalkalibacillus mannanilyticus TaxID=1418 RepID=UPI00046AD169|nr:hypothetical protein [Caldalkalibacillus mannanilyticus]